MTRAEIARRLRDAGIDDSEEEAILLLERYAGKSRAALYADRGYDCADPALSTAVARREGREPLAYILGDCAFFRETYRVTPDVLIPRPDTEILVETALELLPHNARFADFCTGSGCVAISVCVNRPDLTAEGFDISPAAVALARENATRNGAGDRVTFFEKDLLSPGGVCCETDENGRYAAILANPPYVREEVYATLAPEVMREPREAFVAADGGLAFYRTFLSRDKRLLAPRGFFAFEIGYDQGDALRALAATHGYAVTIRRDYGGRDRVAVCRPL